MKIKNCLGKVCKVQFVKILPNKTVTSHYHKEQDEIEYVISGSGTVRSGRKLIRLKPGVIFTVAPNELHEVKAGPEGLLLFVTKANFSDDTEWCE